MIFGVLPNGRVTQRHRITKCFPLPRVFVVFQNRRRSVTTTHIRARVPRTAATDRDLSAGFLVRRRVMMFFFLGRRTQT